nr:hypothetical protein [Tanacetum cinerariifolium]
MKQDIAKQAAHDEKVVPTNDKVRIAKNNHRIYPSMTQTEENFQVALDILKHVPFYNVVLIFAEIDVDTFKKILNLTLNVENQDFIQPPSSDDLKPLSSKKRVLKAVVIQEPPSAPFKKTYDLSGKLKGIKILSDVAQTSSKPGVPDELTENMPSQMKELAFSQTFLIRPKTLVNLMMILINGDPHMKSHSLSSGFVNKFHLNSPNASLLGTITKPTEVTVIPEETQAPPPAAATTITLATQVPNIEVAVSDLATPIIEELVKAHAMNKDVIEESVKAYSVNEVKNFLLQFLPKAVSDFGKHMLQVQILYDKMLESGSSCSHQTHEEIFNTLTWSIKLDESKSTQSTKPNPILKKRDRGDDDEDEDPSTVSNQGKETKKRRIRKETESSKKSSNPKESSRGKPPSKPSKTGKSRSANDVVKETVFEIGSDDVDQTFDKKADDFE